MSLCQLLTPMILEAGVGAAAATAQHRPNSELHIACPGKDQPS